jgi:MFS family permease
MDFINRFRHAIAEYPKMLWLLAVGCFLNIAGLSFLWPLNSIYIHEVLGKPMTVAGIVLLLHSAGATVGFLTGGSLFDRVGARPVLLSGLAVASFVIALPVLFDSWPLYVAVMILFGLSASFVFPAMNALAAKVWPEGGRRAFNFLYVANNIGVAVGSALGGLVAQVSFKLAFLSASLTLLLFALFAYFKIRDPEGTGSRPLAATEAQAAVQESSATREKPLEETIPWLPINALFLGFLILWIVYVQWQSSIAVYMQSQGTALAAYSLLWTINGVLIFCGQPLIALLVRIFKTPASQMFLGTGFFLAAFSLILLSDRYAIFVAGMIILTLGEMLLWPCIPAAVSQMSPPSRLGFLQGLIGSGGPIGRMLGPLIGGLLYDHFTFSTLVLAMIGLMMIPTVCFVIYKRAVRT